jgi:glycosyltransferase involved in cell wall biosynthesis
MKWRVAFLSVVPSPYQRDLFRALAARPEVELEVFYLERAAPDSPWPEAPLAPFEKVLPGFWLNLGGARVHLNRHLPDPRQFELVVLNTLMSVTAQLLLRGALRRSPWIFWGEKLARKGGWHDWLSAPLHRAAAIAAIGSAAQCDYRARFPGPRSFCIPYHCDLDPFLAAPRPPRPNGDVTFLMCGQMIARKGVDLLIEAFTRIDQSRLLLVGREAELPGLLASLSPDVRKRIEYAGFQPPEKLPELFARADVFVLPSRYDGWGVVVNQALGAGLPIICSDAVGAAHDLVDDEVNGMKFPCGDVVALTRMMQRLIDQPELIERWGRASRAKAPAWRPEAGAAKWIAAFGEVLA